MLSLKKKWKSPYGGGLTSKKIVDVLVKNHKK